METRTEATASGEVVQVTEVVLEPQAAVPQVLMQSAIDPPQHATDAADNPEQPEPGIVEREPSATAALQGESSETTTSREHSALWQEDSIMAASMQSTEHQPALSVTQTSGESEELSLAGTLGAMRKRSLAFSVTEQHHLSREASTSTMRSTRRFHMIEHAPDPRPAVHPTEMHFELPTAEPVPDDQLHAPHEHKPLQHRHTSMKPDMAGKILACHGASMHAHCMGHLAFLHALVNSYRACDAAQ